MDFRDYCKRHAVAQTQVWLPSLASATGASEASKPPPKMRLNPPMEKF